jgi:hypothetical protein
MNLGQGHSGLGEHARPRPVWRSVHIWPIRAIVAQLFVIRQGGLAQMQDCTTMADGLFYLQRPGAESR